jgi:hypothetical protein
VAGREFMRLPNIDHYDRAIRKSLFDVLAIEIDDVSAHERILRFLTTT